MSNVVYLMSSLPSLTFGQTPPLTLDNFHGEAKAQLSSKNYNKLQKLDIQQVNQTEPGALKRFFEANGLLHADLTEIRNAKANERSASLATLPKIVTEQNPLEREKSIMKWQWEQLTDIDSGETFTFTEVLAYKFKLQILLRLNSFNVDKGLSILASVVEPSKKMEEN